MPRAFSSRRPGAPSQYLLHQVALHVAIDQRFLRLARQHLRFIERDVALDLQSCDRHEFMVLAVVDAEDEADAQLVLARAALRIDRQHLALARFAEYFEQRLRNGAVGDHAGAGAGDDVARQFCAKRRIGWKAEEDRLERQAAFAAQPETAAGGERGRSQAEQRRQRGNELAPVRRSRRVR
jgi:hypothetical protein